MTPSTVQVKAPPPDTVAENWLVWAGVIAAIAGDTVTWPMPMDTLARLLMPPGPEQATENVVPVAIGPVLCEPRVALASLHPPYAVQVVAFVELQVSTDEPPVETILGLAVIVAVGATFTVTLAVRVPPGYIHASVYRVLEVRAPVLWEPLEDLTPLQPPLAVQDVALDALQVELQRSRRLRRIVGSP